ncbi:MAG TPA: class I SAM-dependent methyltransferase [Phycisphaerae bacterium]|nr:class I SAM-dependent methyltransferase [Phycisphaerae bacterium]
MTKPTEWYKRFFGGLYASVLPKTFEGPDTLRQARVVRRLLRARKGQRVLDIPCGQGRLTIPLASMGMEMTGVDLTAPFIRRAQREARRCALDVRFLRCDMREIDFDGEFDAAFNFFGSFGYFSDADNLAFCRRVLRALRPGGRFLVEGLNRPWLLRHFRPRVEGTIAGVQIVHQTRWLARTNRVSSLWTFHRGRRTETHRIRMRIFSGPELRDLLRKAGFADIQVFGWRPLGPYSPGSRRHIVVGRRPRI